jgi:hypothetical protein
MLDNLLGSARPNPSGHFDDKPIGRLLTAAVVDDDERGSHRDFGHHFIHQ